MSTTWRRYVKAPGNSYFHIPFGRTKKNPPGYDGYGGKQPPDTATLALYNLRTDPGETLDLKDVFPDVVTELTVLADTYRKTLGDQLTGAQGTERREAAVVSFD